MKSFKNIVTFINTILNVLDAWKPFKYLLDLHMPKTENKHRQKCNALKIFFVEIYDSRCVRGWRLIYGLLTLDVFAPESSCNLNFKNKNNKILSSTHKAF